MPNKWVSKRKLVSLSDREVKALEKYSQQVGRTETEIVREALRLYLQGKDKNAFGEATGESIDIESATPL